MAEQPTIRFVDGVRVDDSARIPAPLAPWEAERRAVCVLCQHHRVDESGAGCELLANCRGCQYRSLVRSPIAKCPAPEPRWGEVKMNAAQPQENHHG